MDKIFGLPAHPLLVHIPVVLVPLALLGALLIAFSARLRARLGWTVAVIAVLGGLGAILAAGAGESLEESVNERSLIEQHAEMGEAARLMSVLFAVIVVIFVASDWWLKRRAAQTASTTDGPDSPTPHVRSMRWAVPVAAVATLAVGAGATYTIVDAGHSGATATWQEKVSAQGGARGDRENRNEGYQDGDD